MLCFACERRREPGIDRGALLRHQNGATALVSVRLRTASLQGDGAMLSVVAGAPPLQGDGCLIWRLRNTDLLLTGEAAARDGLRATALEFAVADVATLRGVLDSSGIEYTDGPVGVLVPDRPGQGIDFIFGERA